MRLVTNNTHSKYLYHIAAILLFLNMMPYFWWWTQSSRYLNYAVNFVLCAIFWNNFSGLKLKNIGLIILFIVACFIYAIKSSFVSLVFTIPLLFIPFASNKFLFNVFKSFCFIYCTITGLSLISYGLLHLGLVSPIATIKPLNANDFDYYNVYPIFLVTSNHFDIQSSFRFAGAFDEPGMVGTFSALILFTNSLNFRDWKTYILLISGIVSFSLFFYIVIIIGFVPYFIGRKKIGTVIIALLGVLSIYYCTKDNELLGRMVWDRLEWNSSEKRIAGSDRTVYEAEMLYKSKRWTREYWFGLDDYEPYRQIARGSNSYQNVVMHNGMIFLLVYVLFFVLYAWAIKVTKNQFIVFIILFISCIYQRPQILSCAYIFVYTCLARSDSLKLKK